MAVRFYATPVVIVSGIIRVSFLVRTIPESATRRSDICMITLEQYLAGRDVKYPVTDEQRTNALDLIERLNQLEEMWGQPLILTSGYRPAAINTAIGGAKLSAHTTCQAVDLHDPHDTLAEWLLNNTFILIQLDLYMESPQSARDHVHLQSRPTASGRRVFIA